ncbi:MAG: PCRF domain-containing protein, partial [Bacteroidales bacterium]|nr:PCRF domain-containing protein [Bacteroidales bacterium]
MFDIDRKEIEIAESEEKTQSPEFWNNSKEAEKLLKEIKSLKKWVNDFDSVVEAFEELEISY